MTLLVHSRETKLVQFQVQLGFFKYTQRVKNVRSPFSCFLQRCLLGSNPTSGAIRPGPHCCARGDRVRGDQASLIEQQPAAQRRGGSDGQPFPLHSPPSTVFLTPDLCRENHARISRRKFQGASGTPPHSRSPTLCRSIDCPGGRPGDPLVHALLPWSREQLGLREEEGHASVPPGTRVSSDTEESIGVAQ